MGSQDDEVLAIFLTKIAIKNSVFIGNLIFFSLNYLILLRILAIKSDDYLRRQNDQPNIEQRIFPSLRELPLDSSFFLQM